MSCSSSCQTSISRLGQNSSHSILNSTEKDILEYAEILDIPTTRLIMKILMFAVTPGIGVLGIVGNTLSILIIKKHGFKKCSNVLLLSLAIADIVFLVAFNSIPKIIYETSYVRGYDGFSEEESWVLIVFYSIFMSLDFSSSLVSLLMPMCITLERLIVIFLPLHAFRIVTPKRTWCVVIILVLYSLSLFVYPMAWFELHYVWDPKYNRTIGYREFSSLRDRDANIVKVIDEISVYSIVVVPPLFTVVGCVIIFIKIKIVSLKRTQMTSKEVSTNRTTKMLLAVCAMYTVTCAILTIPINIPVISYGPFSEVHPSNIAIVMYQVMNLAICINSSCNFIIYVGLNKTFRKTYNQIFCSKSALDKSFSMQGKYTASNLSTSAVASKSSQMTSVDMDDDDEL
ncbi:G-protein coupled receptor C02B8.5 [Biomphalaria pfeifferi]|uniref:G-protein coupled receptor C02B8.5 n=1 Tax=Biomphalaria pfeifferi TaxID=112525 RepID=A0AAD8BCT9_BIOPF|nr:G-protein coupled receptor C02B8.5 [Biomphalaria pfeifferi]